MDKSNWIVNNCSRKIPEHVLNFLSLGGKFGLPVNLNEGKDKLNTALEVIKNLKASSYKFPETMIDNVRLTVVNSINRNLHSNTYLNYLDRHLNYEYNKCKKFLKNNDDILVMTADKGQVNVLMDNSVYVQQMSDTLNDVSTYRCLKKNSIRKINLELEGLIKSWLENKLIDEPTYRELKCTNGNLPRCYGLPKIHKPACPLRVVVSSVGSPLYNVSKFLHNILSSSIKKPKSFIKDS